MRSGLPAGQATFWIADPITLRRHCEAAVRALIAMPASTASLRLLADQTANVLVGLQRCSEATALLVAAQRAAFSALAASKSTSRLAAFPRQCPAAHS